MALRALSTAATGMKAMQTKVDTISNNLANVNTTGFKKNRTEFEDLLYQNISRAGYVASDDQGTRIPTGMQVGLGTRLTSTTKLHQQGSLRQTGRDLDIAIENDGFFRVQQPDGSTAYTRDGSFHRDAEGNMVTSDGLKLEEDIVIPEQFTGINISVDGTVEGFDPQNPAEKQELGQIQLARFTNPEGLDAVGENLYEQTEASGEAIVANPTEEGMGSLRQGFLEASNVEAVRELTDMIEAQRAFELNSNSIDTGDQMLQTINRLGR